MTLLRTDLVAGLFEQCSYFLIALLISFFTHSRFLHDEIYISLVYAHLILKKFECQLAQERLLSSTNVLSQAVNSFYHLRSFIPISMGIVPNCTRRGLDWLTGAL